MYEPDSPVCLSSCACDTLSVWGTVSLHRATVKQASHSSTNCQAAPQKASANVALSQHWYRHWTLSSFLSLQCCCAVAPVPRGVWKTGWKISKEEYNKYTLNTCILTAYFGFVKMCLVGEQQIKQHYFRKQNYSVITTMQQKDAVSGLLSKSKPCCYFSHSHNKAIHLLFNQK